MRQNVAGNFEVFIKATSKHYRLKVKMDGTSTVEQLKSSGVALSHRILDFQLSENVSCHHLEKDNLFFGRTGFAKAFEGLGIRVAADGRTTVGNYRNGALNGICRVALPGGDYYFGVMKNDAPEGEGLYFDGESKRWLYGFFKGVECVNLVKSGIDNPLLFKRRIFKNTYDRTRIHERAKAEVQETDFSKLVLESLIPHLEKIEGFEHSIVKTGLDHKRAKSVGSRKSSSQSIASAFKLKDTASFTFTGATAQPMLRDSNHSEHVGIKSMLQAEKAKRAQPKPPQSPNKDKQPSMPKAIPSNSPRLEQRSTESQQMSENGELELAQFEQQIHRIRGHLESQSTDYFMHNSVNRGQTSRLGTIHEYDEDFCKSKSSIGPEKARSLQTTPSAINKGQLSQGQLSQGQLSHGLLPNTTNLKITDMMPENEYYVGGAFHKDRIPSPKPTDHYELSPTTNGVGFKLFNSTLANPSSNNSSARQSNRVNNFIKPQSRLSERGSDTHHNSAEAWFVEEQARFQLALQRLSRMDTLVNQIQQQVQLSRNTQLFF